MKKRQIFMMLIAIWLARIISVKAQEEMPVIVDPPRVSMTVFTNWQEIRLTYTVRWLDGYRPLFDQVKPENMSFSPFELDPIRSHELELRNQRKYKHENYVDVIYYLRHIGEKKGDIAIPEQVFTYVREEPGKTLEKLEIKEFKAAGIILRYDSVLTKDADDIMDRIDFGSFEKQENLFKGLMSGLALIFSIATFLLFRKPATFKAKNKSKSKISQNGAETPVQERYLTPKEAIKHFQGLLDRLLVYATTEPSQAKTQEAIGHLYNELRWLLSAHCRELAESDTTKEITVKIFKLEPVNRFNKTLRLLCANLQIYDDILFTGQEMHLKSLAEEIKLLKYGVNELRPIRVLRYNLLERKKKLSERLIKLFRRAR